MTKLLTLLIFLVLLIALASPASAHTSSFNPDTGPYGNHNGTVEVYVSHGYHGEWRQYRIIANRKLRLHAPNVPRMVRVPTKARAEVWVHKTTLWGCAGNSRGDADGYTGLPEVRTGYQCSGVGMLSHEMGHMYGLPDGPIYWIIDGQVVMNRSEDKHHLCTPHWQRRTVDVGETPNDGISGCNITIKGFGPHDLRALRNTVTPL